MPLHYFAPATDDVGKLRDGGIDANGRLAEASVSDGNGKPCRHCLRGVPEDDAMLILAWRPFTGLRHYAEPGPIFLCADACQRYPETNGPPALYRSRDMLTRGYDADDRIVYGTGKVGSAQRLETADIAYVHARSPTNNCYHFRIESASGQYNANRPDPR